MAPSTAAADSHQRPGRPPLSPEIRALRAEIGQLARSWRLPDSREASAVSLNYSPRALERLERGESALGWAALDYVAALAGVATYGGYGCAAGVAFGLAHPDIEWWVDGGGREPDRWIVADPPSALISDAARLAAGGAGATLSRAWRVFFLAGAVVRPEALQRWRAAL